MRYFLDTEYNGYGGQLISLGLTPEHGDQEFYAVLPLPDLVEPWVERNVVPYLRTAPIGGEEVAPIDAAHDLASYLQKDEDPLIVADWPDDIAHFCSLLITGPGRMVALDRIGFRLLRTNGSSAAAGSAVPHNALHDARALRDLVLAQEAFDGAVETAGIGAQERAAHAADAAIRAPWKAATAAPGGSHLHQIEPSLERPRREFDSRTAQPSHAPPGAR